MRRLALIAALLLFAAPAEAQSIADQAQRAYQTFAGGLSQKDFLLARYGRDLFDKITGKWARLTGPSSVTGIETYGSDVEKICASPAAVSLSAPTPQSLAVTTNFPKDNFTQTYELIAGSTFGENTEVAPYLLAIGLGPDNVGEKFDEQRAVALTFVNGLVQIYRPSADVLVMTRDRGYPLVLARCPA